MGTLGPTISLATEAVVCAWNDLRPSLAPTALSTPPIKKRSQDTATLVARLVEQLKKGQTRFALAWFVIGSDDAHLDHSSNMERLAIRHQLIGFLQHNMHSQIS